MHADQTLFTVMRDPQNLRMYYKSYDDQTIRVVDLNRFDLDAKEVMRLPTATDTQPVVDMSGKFLAKKTAARPSRRLVAVEGVEAKRLSGEVAERRASRLLGVFQRQQHRCQTLARLWVGERIGRHRRRGFAGTDGEAEVGRHAAEDGERARSLSVVARSSARKPLPPRISRSPSMFARMNANPKPLSGSSGPDGLASPPITSIKRCWR